MQDETATPMMVRADELTAGDIIRYGGDDLQVYSEPEYLIRGMVFDALPLGLEATGETQQMCLHPQLRVQLLDHQKPIAADPAAAHPAA